MASYGKDSIIDITKILNEYSHDIQDGITQSAFKVAENGKNKLKVTSPKKSGDYRKGWRVNKRQGNGYVHTTIYNATDWQLTHLLEKPHALRNGRLSKPQVHIEPVEQECIEEYKRSVENVIKNGGM